MQFGIPIKILITVFLVGLSLNSFAMENGNESNSNKSNSNKSNSSDPVISPTSSTPRGWTHAELGASNYGLNVNADGTYKTGELHPELQNKLLFDTVDSLIREKGNKGIFYVNDKAKEDVDYTIAHLQEYVSKKHPESRIEFKALSGDFFQIDIPVVDSIHLKNPEKWFFKSLEDPRNDSRLKYFADHSREGLSLVTYYKRPMLKRLGGAGVGYKIVNDEFPEYRHADGAAITRFGPVWEFLIKAEETLEKEGTSGFIIGDRKKAPCGSEGAEYFGKHIAELHWLMSMQILPKIE